MIFSAQSGDRPTAFEQLLASERPRLVRLCAHLAGDAAVGEDLAQETLLEAWRRQERLTDWSGSGSWLAAIARYVCLRWRRRQGRQVARHAVPAALSSEQREIAEQVADPLELEQVLEEQELAELVERALGLLSPETRRLLLLRYVDELPQTEIAERLQLSQGAVAMRLQRGRQAVRRLLAGQLEADAAAYELAEQELRIWCPFCGRSRILLRREAGGSAIFRCARCTGSATTSQIVNTLAELRLSRLKHPRALLSRALALCHSRYRAALASRLMRCWRCGNTLPVSISHDSSAGARLDIVCQRCGEQDRTPVQHLVLDLPETLRFWQQHPRMRLLPARPVSFGGREALLVTYESLDSQAAIEVVSSSQTLEVLAIEAGGR